MNMLTYIPEYEKLTGKKLAPQVIRLIERLNECGKQFERRGCEDAAQNYPAASDDVFRSWADKSAVDNPEMAGLISDLMQLCYMDSYEAETKRREAVVLE